MLVRNNMNLVLVLDLILALVGSFIGVITRIPDAISFSSWNWTYLAAYNSFPLDWGQLLVGMAAFAVLDTAVLAVLTRRPVDGMAAVRLVVLAAAVAALLAWGPLLLFRPRKLPASLLLFAALAVAAFQAGARIVTLVRDPARFRRAVAAGPRTANALLLFIGLLLAGGGLEGSLRLLGNPLGFRVQGRPRHHAHRRPPRNRQCLGGEAGAAHPVYSQRHRPARTDAAAGGRVPVVGLDRRRRRQHHRGSRHLRPIDLDRARRGPAVGQRRQGVAGQCRTGGTQHHRQSAGA